MRHRVREGGGRLLLDRLQVRRGGCSHPPHLVYSGSLSHLPCRLVTRTPTTSACAHPPRPNPPARSLAVLERGSLQARAEFVLKTDDDSYVYMRRLLAELREAPRRGYFWGYDIGEFKPHRDSKARPSAARCAALARAPPGVAALRQPGGLSRRLLRQVRRSPRLPLPRPTQLQSQWYMPYEEWPADEPPMRVVSGAGYVMSADVATFAARESHKPTARRGCCSCRISGGKAFCVAGVHACADTPRIETPPAGS